MDWRKLISQTVGQEQLPDISTFLANEALDDSAPIDMFYEQSQRIIQNTPVDVNPDEWFGAMNVVALVSSTENYFRNILSRVLSICMVTRKNAADNNINFGSVLWYPFTLVERGAFEHIAFSDAKKIAEITKKYVGIDVKNYDLIPILEEFSKICELRHGIVHSGRYLAGKNALLLDFPSSDGQVKINIGYGQLQSIAAVCTTLVVSYNQKIFEVLCKRWAVDWRQSQLWDVNMENVFFKGIWDLFHSKIDKANGAIEETGTWIKCRNLVRAEFNIH